MICLQRMTAYKSGIGLFFFLLLSLVCPAGEAGVIEGRVMDGTEPVAGIEVAAYTSLDFTGESLGEPLPMQRGFTGWNCRPVSMPFLPVTTAVTCSPSAAATRWRWMRAGTGPGCRR